MLDIYNSYKGYLKIDTLDKNNKIISSTFINNTITYTGASFLAKATYDPKYKITHIYGEYGTSSDYTEGVLPGITVDRTDTIATLRESPRSTTNAESGVIYQSTNPSSSDYTGNIVTFIASWNSASIDDMIFVGAGLVCKIGTEELLFSHVYYPGKKKKENESLMVTWSVQFN